MRFSRLLSLFLILQTLAFLPASQSGQAQPSGTGSTFQIPDSNDGLPGAGPIRRYVAKNDRLIVTTPPEGRKIQQIWTTREFPSDFILVLEFRASPFADSGVFIRGRQLQCRDYLLAGPYKELHLYRPQDWNELVVKVKGELAQATCNGEILESAFKIPETGPIGLEGDRGQMEYRRIRIKEINRALHPPPQDCRWCC